MTWSYRIVRYTDGTLGLHEIFYDEDGKPVAVTSDPITFVVDAEEGADGLVRNLGLALHDAQERPALSWGEIPSAGKDPSAGRAESAPE